MAFSLQAFCKLRPFAYHLTASGNLSYLQRTRVLYSASSLMKMANDVSGLRTKRKTASLIHIADNPVTIRDQKPLHQGNVSLLDDMSFDDFVQYLNSHVFFWPGNDEDPIDYGIRHFERYKSEQPSPIVLRIPTCQLFENNIPLFSKYNSGAPRCTNGRGSPRGPMTFLEASHAEFKPSEVKELTFLKAACLSGIEVKYSILGSMSWQSL